MPVVSERYQLILCSSISHQPAHFLLRVRRMKTKVMWRLICFTALWICAFEERERLSASSVDQEVDTKKIQIYFYLGNLWYNICTVYTGNAYITVYLVVKTSGQLYGNISMGNATFAHTVHTRLFLHLWKGTGTRLVYSIPLTIAVGHMTIQSRIWTTRSCLVAPISPSPEDAVAPGGSTSLLAGVVIVRELIVLVGGVKVQISLDELVKYLQQYKGRVTGSCLFKLISLCNEGAHLIHGLEICIAGIQWGMIIFYWLCIMI